MKILVLSHYNLFFRPYIFLKAPESLEREDLKQIPILMDIYESGFYKHEFGTFKTANLLFEIPSEYSRIKKEKLCISLVYDSKSKINSSLTEELLRNFVNDLKKIEDLFKAFYVNSKIHKGDINKFNEIKTLLESFYSTFPEENVIFEQKEAKILIFGLSLSGKTTLIRSLRESVSKTIFPTISVDVSRIILNNISLLTYDTPGQPKLKELWKPYLKEQDGLIFVLDITDKIKFSNARALLHEIANISELRALPILILFNKVDLTQPDVDLLVQTMELNKLGNRPVKYFLTSGIKNLNIEDAFNWLALKISEKVTIPSIKSDLGLIFSKWDENIGVKIVSVYPTNAFNDPELIAARCFSIAQFIFGGEEFKRSFVILPFPHLKANAAIYFDSLPSDTIRGGILPLCLILYYDERIPKVIVDQFNSYVFDHLAKIKEIELNKENITKVLETIHSTILSQISSLNTTVQALKIVEIGYEALFKGARDAILIIDRKSGIIVDANKQAENIIQLPFEDLIGLHANQILTASDTLNEDFKTKIFENINNATPLALDLISTSGLIIPVEININDVQMAGQSLIQCIIRDITDRKNIEKNLKTSETKYRHLFEDSPFDILLINPIGVVVDLNPGFERNLGYNREEIIGKRFVDLSVIQKDYLVDLLKHFTKEERGKHHPPMELKLYKKDGTAIWTSFQFSFVDIGSNKFYQIIGHDITEQKEIEQDLKQILKLVTIITKTSSRLVGIKDIDNTINEALREIGELLNSSGAYVYYLEENTIVMKKIYSWFGKLIYPPISKPSTLTLNDFPWVMEKLRTNDYIYLKDVSELPDEAKDFQFFMESQKVKSFLFLPMKIAINLKGFVGFDNISNISGLKEENFTLLGIFSETIKNTIEQKRVEQSLRKSEETFHKEYDRTYFYRELFVSDIFNLIKNIQSSIEMYQPHVKFQAIKDLFSEIKRQCIDGEQLVSIVRKSAALEESKAPIKKIEVNKMLDDAIQNTIKLFPDKKIKIDVDSSDKELFACAGEFLTDVFENILTASIKYNKSQDVEFKIFVRNWLDELHNQNFVKIEFVDYKKDISNIEKKRFLEKERDTEPKIKEVLLVFLFIERILEQYKGRIWVEGNNFVVLVPSP